MQLRDRIGARRICREGMDCRRQQSQDFARLFDDNRLITDGAQRVCVARGEEGIAGQSFGVGRREWRFEGIGTCHAANAHR